MMHHRCYCGGNSHSQEGTCICCGGQTDSYYQHQSFTPNYSYPPIVDCTLSLATPSTRLTTQDHQKQHHHHRRSSITNFSWNLKNKGGGGTTNTNHDSLLARRCANCDTTSTPLWRNGPRGPKSLCNACGIRYKKEERRANAAASATSPAATGGVTESSAHAFSHYTNNSPWYAYSAHVEDSCENDVPNFLSWRLNVADRTGLVHDFK